MREEIVQHLVKETDFGKDLDKVVEELKAICGGDFTRVCGDVWSVLLDKAENEAHDTIKMVRKKDRHCVRSFITLVHCRVGPRLG